MTTPTMAQTGSAASASNALKIYGSGDSEVRALDGVSVTFERGKFTAIMGPSGSGNGPPTFGGIATESMPVAWSTSGSAAIWS
ncbi:MAG: ABC transporter ATP-binding protein, partial [Actinomycetota bacterium]